MKSEQNLDLLAQTLRDLLEANKWLQRSLKIR